MDSSGWRIQLSVEMAIWRMTDSGPRPLKTLPLDFEERLEKMLSEDPSISGIDLLIVGRQVRTSYGGYIDLLALDGDGRVHVLELKRDRTPRDVVAQALDYGSWVQGLGAGDLEQIYRNHHADQADLGEAFAERFGSPLPNVVNADQQFTIIASELDPTSDRIVEFLAESYGVPINAVFFRHFKDDDRDYLARTWLLDPSKLLNPSKAATRSGSLSRLGQFRRDFWAHFVKVQPDAPGPPSGYADSNVYYPVEPADLRICQYLAQDKVGMYLTGTTSRGDADVKKRIAQHTDALAKELGEKAKVSGSGSIVLKIDSNDRNNWDKMAQWLEDQRAIYERVLLNGPAAND